MVQTIITILIVLAAAIIALIRLFSFFTDPPDKCRGCSQSCGGCSLEELFHNTNITPKMQRDEKHA
jgi:hypothetical protein